MLDDLPHRAFQISLSGIKFGQSLRVLSKHIGDGL